MRAARLAAIATLLAASGCVLPNYDKVGANASGAKGSDAGEPDAGDGLAGATPECNSCIQENCAQQLNDCGPDCQGLTFPITPATQSPDAMAPLLICLQNSCDACNVQWGCVNHYRWPQATQAYTVTVKTIDIASSAELTDVNVLACQGSDPSCSPSSGLVGMGDTNSMARATLAVPRDFIGTFQFKGTGDYMPASALWSQPTYTVRDNFTQRMITWAVAEGLASATGATVRRDAGHMIFRAQNCLPMRYQGASGELRADADGETITFTPPTKDSSKIFYTGATSTLDPTLEGTTSLGGAFGGAFNLPSTLVTVIGKRNGVEVSRAALQIRPGTVGFVYLMPSAL